MKAKPTSFPLPGQGVPLAALYLRAQSHVCHLSQYMAPPALVSLTGSTTTKKTVTYGLWAGQKTLIQDLTWKIPRYDACYGEVITT